MSDGFVYFIQMEETGDIKIGFSEKHPTGRLKEFQTGNSNKLILLGYIEGTYQDESNLHREFYEERIRNENEWFKPSPRLKERIKELLEESLEEKKSGIDDLNFEYKEEEREKGVLYQGFVNEKTVWLKSKNDKIDGNYVFKNVDGGEYVGEIEDGVPHGQGTLTNSSGKYEGEWKDGKYHGQGKFIGMVEDTKILWRSPRLEDSIWSPSLHGTYVGEYKDGEPWNGTIYDKKGNIDSKYVNGVKQ